MPIVAGSNICVNPDQIGVNWKQIDQKWFSQGDEASTPRRCMEVYFS